MGYNSVADNLIGSIFIRLAVVGSQISEIPRNFKRTRTYILVKVVQRERFWCQSKAHMRLPISH